MNGVFLVGTMRVGRNVDGLVGDDWRDIRRALVLFFVLAFVISLVFVAIPVVPAFGPLLAAVIVTAQANGLAGLRGLVSRMWRWRVPLRWWLVAVSPGLFLLTALAVLWLAGQELPTAAEFSGFGGADTLGVVGFLVLTLAASAGEEIGWRGYALPQLQRRFSPLAATLILAVVWWLWHFVFLLPVSLPFSRMRALLESLLFLALITCIAVILTWLYNRSGGSILLVIVWHGAYNFAETAVPIISLVVIVQGLLLVFLELRARRDARSILGSRGGPRNAAARALA